ncbi:hypothetical protein [Chitinophaga rhizosphaerae]|uniref:hypothetical protein n=1 Tax=Chitinophaga rhizosphaerae TaxID=1864947 RepID=UPI000F8127FD|nr:hypothetical protein [Chitinophaga rhizosphaerae]
MRYTNIVVEKQETGLTWENPVIVSRNFDHIAIGKAWLRIGANGEIVADIETDNECAGLYPAIGYKFDTTMPDKKTITGIGLCDNMNLDATISPL